MNKYIGAFLMLAGVLAFGVTLLGLALAIVDPLAGGLAACLAVTTGFVGAQIVGDN
jgi:hypothetical protein